MFHKSCPIAIDISDTSLEMAQLRPSRERWEILALNRIILPAHVVDNTTIINQELLMQKIKELLNNSKPSPAQGSKIRISMPSKKTFFDFVKIAAGSQTNIKQQLEEQAQNKLPIVLKNYQVIYHRINSIGGFDRYYLAAADFALINSYQAVFAKIGLNLEVIDLEAFALVRALIKQPTLQNQAFLILDIGAITTDIHIIDPNGLVWSSYLKIGGDRFTQDISQKISLSLKEAEILKRTYGFLADKKEGRLVNILQASFQPIVNHFKSAIEYYQHQYSGKIGNIIISGGSALIPGVTDYLTANFRVPTSLADPLIRFGWQDWSMSWPPVFFSNVLGLCLWQEQKDKFNGFNFIENKKSIFSWRQKLK